MAGLSKLTHKLKALRWRHVILLVALLALAYGGYKAYRVWALARSLQSRLNQLQVLADGGGDLEPCDIGESLRGAQADLEALPRRRQDRGRGSGARARSGRGP